MPTGLREDVHEGENILVLEHSDAGQITTNDFRENILIVICPVEAHGAFSD